jgi:lysophospholipase L1-like esterase
VVTLRASTLRSWGALVACVAAISACASSSNGASGTVVPGGSGGAAQPTPVAQSATPRLAYAALGASETFGTGASPITNGYAYRLRDALHLTAAQFADVAIPGTTLADGYQPELTNALAIQPTIATVFFGANDIRAGVTLAHFTSDLTDMVSTLRRVHAQVLIIGLPDLSFLPALRGSAAASSSSVAAWNAAMQRVATLTGAGFLSLDPFTTEITSHPEDIAPDGLHPSNQGHARLAEIVLTGLQSRGFITA